MPDKLTNFMGLGFVTGKVEMEYLTYGLALSRLTDLPGLTFQTGQSVEAMYWELCLLTDDRPLEVLHRLSVLS